MKDLTLLNQTADQGSEVSLEGAPSMSTIKAASVSAVDTVKGWVGSTRSLNEERSAEIQDAISKEDGEKLAEVDGFIDMLVSWSKGDIKDPHLIKTLHSTLMDAARTGPGAVPFLFKQVLATIVQTPTEDEDFTSRISITGAPFNVKPNMILQLMRPSALQAGQVGSGGWPTSNVSWDEEVVSIQAHKYGLALGFDKEILAECTIPLLSLYGTWAVNAVMRKRAELVFNAVIGQARAYMTNTYPATFETTGVNDADAANGTLAWQDWVNLLFEMEEYGNPIDSLVLLVHPLIVTAFATNPMFAGMGASTLYNFLPDKLEGHLAIYGLKDIVVSSRVGKRTSSGKLNTDLYLINPEATYVFDSQSPQAEEYYSWETETITYRVSAGWGINVFDPQNRCAKITGINLTDQNANVPSFYMAL